MLSNLPAGQKGRKNAADLKRFPYFCAALKIKQNMDDSNPRTYNSIN